MVVTSYMVAREGFSAGDLLHAVRRGKPDLTACGRRVALLIADFETDWELASGNLCVTCDRRTY